jgi:rod shape-determining protein MreC
MGKSGPSLKPLVLLVLVLLAWWLTPPLLKSFTQISFQELQAPAWSAASHLRDLQLYWSLRSHSKQTLIESVRDLARLNAAYELSRQRESALRKEVEHLEKILDLPPLPEYEYIVARVTRRDINQWWQQITIRRGLNDGIQEGAAVVYAGGVVGRVQEVFSHSATVQLVSSPGFRIASTIEGDRRPITYQGRATAPFGAPEGKINNVPTDYHPEDIQSKRLITSHLGGVFPEGLTIGIIASLSPRPDGLFQEGTIALSPELMSLSEVAVLIPIEPKDN